jgi:RNA polymerase sigma factor (sigma-70 family)
MPNVQLDLRLLSRLHARANAGRWALSVEQFASVLESSVARAFGDEDASSDRVERYLASLHLEDLALACGCAAGHDGAWEHFMREHRPVLYRAADATDPTGGARELADSLYAELYGLTTGKGERRSLFRYFHGRSSLATWLRAVLAQRHVDRLRSARRLDPLPDDAARDAITATVESFAPERARFLESTRRALTAAVARLAARDRLRLACYYAQDLTLAQIGRALGEHEATTSRHLTRIRRIIRDDVEQQLRVNERMSAAEIDECFSSIIADAGPLDLADVLGAEPAGKKFGRDRST